MLARLVYSNSRLRRQPGRAAGLPGPARDQPAPLWVGSSSSYRPIPRLTRSARTEFELIGTGCRAEVGGSERGRLPAPPPGSGTIPTAQPGLGTALAEPSPVLFTLEVRGTGPSLRSYGTRVMKFGLSCGSGLKPDEG